MRIRMDTAPFQEYLRKLKQMKDTVAAESKRHVNRITDRHIARVKENTDVGDSPDSPSLRNAWDRSGVRSVGGAIFAEVFNPLEYAAYYEYGHRQTPGRLVFIELAPGQEKYGRPAREMKSGIHQGKWGIVLRLKKAFVKGKFVMTNSETKAQAELDAAAKRIVSAIRKGLS